MSKNDGSIIIKAVVDKKQAQKELTALEKQIDKTEQQINEMQIERDEANQKSIFKGAELDAEKVKLEEIRQTLLEIKATAKDTSLSESVRTEAKAQLPSAEADLKEQQERVRMLQSEYNKVTGSVERYDKSIEKATRKLDKQKEEAGELVKKISSTPQYYENMAAAQEKAAESARRLGNRLKEAVSSALVFSLISRALASFKEWMGKVIQTNEEASTAIARLKGALLALVQPIVNAVIPVFVAFMNILTAVVSAIANVVSILFGGSVSESKKQAKALNEQTEAIDGVGSAAEEAAGSLANFDEINTLSSQQSSGGGGGGTSAAEGLADFSALDQFDSEEYKQKIEEITTIVSGALLALGAILFFSGANMPLGLGLMAAGALGLAAMIKENWDSGNEKVRETINKTLLILGGAFLVIGAVLAFSGANVPLGLGLMAVGAAALVTYAALNWDNMSDPVKKAVTAIMVILGGAMLVIGAVLAFSGGGPKKIAMGVAIMAIGAASLATATALNWNTIENALRGPIGIVTALVSAAALVIGAILCFSGVALPIGVSLIAVGAAGLATTIAVNWNTIVNALRGPIGTVTAIVSAAVLVLGIILCFTGVGIPLGVALIAAGAAGLVTVTAINWDGILDKLKETWNKIKTWWNTDVSKFFTLQYWKDLGSDMITGLMDGLSGIFSKIKTWASDVWTNITNGISGNASTSGYGISVSSMPTSTTYSVPGLATGAVIPPNREFLAILGDQTSGTNIETPESLLRKIIREETEDSDALYVLRDILTAVREGKNLVVDKRVLGKVASEAITERARASGKAVVTT